MRVWIYARLSKDDDPARCSLENQHRLLRDFAQKHRYTVVGSSADDNVSGMSFQRSGLDALTQAVERGEIDCVLVKDLSRLGRHRTQTALFIDYLREHQVGVLSATEGLDTRKEEDDLIIGVRGLMNDYYVQDISRKIRSGYHQKQQAGLVIRAPFGYWKDRNTGKILPHPEAAETVQLIFDLYRSGHGQKEIARTLNRLGRRTPQQICDENCGKRTEKPYIWSYVSVKNILTDECCIGVLANRRTTTCNAQRTPVPQSEQLRHEGYFPPLVSREEWDEVQQRLTALARPSYGNKTRHRYAGLLVCSECGRGFLAMKRCWRGRERVEYICKGYHSDGADRCTAHRIHEEVLDAEVRRFAEGVRERWKGELEEVRRLERVRVLRQPALERRMRELRGEVERLEEEVEEIVMERIRSYSVESD